MPVYNAEMYLQEAIDSILNQTLRELELIIIDDCSLDSTCSIIQVNASKDNRICVYGNQTRQGAPFSRNLGIDVAKGEYLYFCDADDWMHSELLEKAHEKLVIEQADFIELPCVRVTNIEEFQKGNYKKYEKVPYMPQCLYEKSALELMCSDFVWRTSTCMKIYDSQFIKGNNLYFQNLSSSNDVYFSSMAYFLAKKMTQLIDSPEIAYYNRRHMGVDRISMNREPINVYLAWMRILHELIKRDILEESINYFILYGSWMMQGGSFEEVDTKKKREYYDFLYEVGLDSLIASVKLYSKIEQKFAICIVNLLKDSIINEESRKRFNKFSKLLIGISIYCEGFWKKLLDNKKIGIWGYGNYGKILIEILEENEIEYHYIYDQSAINGVVKDGHYTIELFDENSQVDLILVSSNKYYEEINQSIKELQPEMQVINVLECMQEYVMRIEEDE